MPDKLIDSLHQAKFLDAFFSNKITEKERIEFYSHVKMPDKLIDSLNKSGHLINYFTKFSEEEGLFFFI